MPLFALQLKVESDGVNDRDGDEDNDDEDDDNDDEDDKDEDDDETFWTSSRGLWRFMRMHDSSNLSVQASLSLSFSCLFQFE